MKEIIVVKQLPVIVEQLQTIKAEVTERVNAAMNLVCNEDTIQTVKKIRTELNKEFGGWEEKRKEVKKAIMSPYDQFEAVYKDCITDVFKKADTDLKCKIASVENEEKAKKETEVKRYFTEYATSVLSSDFSDIEQLYKFADINITLSASVKSLKEKAKAFVDKVHDDILLISTQEHCSEIMYEYGKTFNVSSAIRTVTERYKAIEETKAREVERQAKEEAEQTAVKKVVDVLTPPTVEIKEQIITTTFTVKGTKAQLKALKEFLNKGGYEYK